MTMVFSTNFKSRIFHYSSLCCFLLIGKSSKLFFWDRILQVIKYFSISLQIFVNGQNFYPYRYKSFSTVKTFIHIATNLVWRWNFLSISLQISFDGEKTFVSIWKSHSTIRKWFLGHKKKQIETKSWMFATDCLFTLFQKLSGGKINVVWGMWCG